MVRNLDKEYVDINIIYKQQKEYRKTDEGKEALRRANKKYRNANLPIRFELSDTLSGFEDDRNILIKLDGNWMIPEYDPETFICQTQPIKSLEVGEHHLAIVVTDRMGNKSEKYLKFWIRAKSKKR